MVHFIKIWQNYIPIDKVGKHKSVQGSPSFTVIHNLFNVTSLFQM